jgi:hypothetical protein
MISRPKFTTFRAQNGLAIHPDLEQTTLMSIVPLASAAEPLAISCGADWSGSGLQSCRSLCQRRSERDSACRLEMATVPARSAERSGWNARFADIPIDQNGLE